MKQLHCLIIDDEPIAREGIASYCAEFSFINIVALCKNVFQANEYIKTQQVDLVFLDINMPIMDGWEFIDEYKKLPEDIKSNIIITMLTTSVNPDDEKMANSIPEINYFLQKPLTEKKLSDTINMFY